MKLPQKTIDEVVARLEREQSIREIYVEGLFDRDFFRWVLECLELPDVKVYPISTVAVPDSLLIEQGLTHGERQRVQALASRLANHPELQNRVILIIDADLDYLLDRANYAAPLLGTASASTDILLWRENALNKFASLVLGSEDPQRLTSELMAFTEPIASDLFLFRAAKEAIGAVWKLIEAEDAIERGKAFSLEEYCCKVADKNAARTAMAKLFPDALAIVREKAANIPLKKRMHGHDLLALATKKLRIDGHKHQCLRDPFEAARILMMALDWSDLLADETISAIRNTFGRGPAKPSIAQAVT